MIYFIYSGVYHEKDSEKGIYHYTIYKDMYTYHVNSAYKVIPFLTAADFIMAPIAAALKYILKKRKFKKYDQIRIMCKDRMVSQIINLKRLYKQCPGFTNFWEGEFKNYQKCAMVFNIDLLVTDKLFKINPNLLYEKEQKRVQELKKLLFAS